jgi:hypothetical protein
MKDSVVVSRLLSLDEFGDPIFDSNELVKCRIDRSLISETNQDSGSTKSILTRIYTEEKLKIGDRIMFTFDEDSEFLNIQNVSYFYNPSMCIAFYIAEV